jgi:hypothetical protein
LEACSCSSRPALTGSLVLGGTTVELLTVARPSLPHLPTAYFLMGAGAVILAAVLLAILVGFLAGLLTFKVKTRWCPNCGAVKSCPRCARPGLPRPVSVPGAGQWAAGSGHPGWHAEAGVSGTRWAREDDDGTRG